MLPLKGRTVVMGSNAEVLVTGGGSGFVSPFLPFLLPKDWSSYKSGIQSG